MQSSDSFHGFGYTFWTFWIIALRLLYKLWISNILAKSITEETCIVEMRIGAGKLVPLMLFDSSTSPYCLIHFLSINPEEITLF